MPLHTPDPGPGGNRILQQFAVSLTPGGCCPHLTSRASSLWSPNQRAISRVDTIQGGFQDGGFCRDDLGIYFRGEYAQGDGRRYKECEEHRKNHVRDDDKEVPPPVAATDRGHAILSRLAMATTTPPAAPAASHFGVSTT